MCTWRTIAAAIDLALVLQKRGENEAANILLDGAARVIRTIPRLGISGYWISDVAIHALRGQKAEALAALRDAEKAGWRGPFWRYYRDIEPTSPRSATSPNSKPCSPTSSATWRNNAPDSPHDRRMRRLISPSADPSSASRQPARRLTIFSHLCIAPELCADCCELRVHLRVTRQTSCRHRRRITSDVVVSRTEAADELIIGLHLVGRNDGAGQWPSLPQIYLTQNDMDHLLKLVEAQPGKRFEKLESELVRANVGRVKKIPEDVVTMNSRVIFENETTRERREITLVYPGSADIDAGKDLRPFPLETALLGLRVGQSIDWELPGGEKAALPYRGSPVPA